MQCSTTVSQVVSYENELPAPGLRKCMNEQFVSLKIDVLKKGEKKNPYIQLFQYLCGYNYSLERSKKSCKKNPHSRSAHVGNCQKRKIVHGVYYIFHITNQTDSNQKRSGMIQRKISKPESPYLRLAVKKKSIHSNFPNSDSKVSMLDCLMKLPVDDL